MARQCPEPAPRDNRLCRTSRSARGSAAEAIASPNQFWRFCCSVLQEVVADERNDSMTLLNLMLLPSLAAGVVLLASVVFQSVRREW